GTWGAIGTTFSYTLEARSAIGATFSYTLEPGVRSEPPSATRWEPFSEMGALTTPLRDWPIRVCSFWLYAAKVFALNATIATLITTDLMDFMAATPETM
ncbi:hypothetical protein, partial [Pseudomonas monteilii]|uniref:hypothetical protein n=1 Tax=Pseudomonas monteilii TaxID=76759 RepID=UPI0005347C9A